MTELTNHYTGETAVRIWWCLMVLKGAAVD